MRGYIPEFKGLQVLRHCDSCMHSEVCRDYAKPGAMTCKHYREVIKTMSWVLEVNFRDGSSRKVEFVEMDQAAAAGLAVKKLFDKEVESSEVYHS